MGNAEVTRRESDRPAQARAYALAYALAHHGDQVYGDRPYREHLEAVERVLLDFGFVGPFWRCCAWLHDTIEDTTATIEEIAALFGPTVADTVFRVSGEGLNRKARNESIYRKIAGVRSACVVKAADRIANVENAVATDSALARMYASEADAFDRAVAFSLPIEMLRRLRAAYGDFRS